MTQLSDLFHGIANNWDSILAAIGGVVVAVEVLVRTLQAITGVLAKFALMTATKVDDDAVSKLSTVLTNIASGLRTVEQFIPRAKLGKTVQQSKGDFVVESTIAAAEIRNSSHPASPGGSV